MCVEAGGTLPQTLSTELLMEAAFTPNMLENEISAHQSGDEKDEWKCCFLSHRGLWEVLIMAVFLSLSRSSYQTVSQIFISTVKVLAFQSKSSTKELPRQHVLTPISSYCILSQFWSSGCLQLITFRHAGCFHGNRSSTSQKTIGTVRGPLGTEPQTGRIMHTPIRGPQPSGYGPVPKTVVPNEV